MSQTGVQVLAGFLVTLPFQSRFEELDSFQRGWYVGLLALAFATVSVMLPRWPSTAACSSPTPSPSSSRPVTGSPAWPS